jgi:hypothetical protein
MRDERGGGGSGTGNGGGCGGPGQQSCLGNSGGDDDEDDSKKPSGIVNDLQGVNVPSLVDPLDPNRIFNPFTTNLQLPPSCLNTERGCIPSRYETEIRFDILHNPEKLGWDLVGLGLSITGIKSVQNAIGLNAKVVNLLTGIDTTRSIATSNGDVAGLILTGVGLYPPAAVYASSVSVIKDMFYTVTVHKLLPGPPAGPYCDGNYGY